MNSIPHTSGVYQILCIPTGKVYIGSSRDLQHRIASHQRLLNSGKHENSYLLRAWRKYGAEAFVFTVIELCELEDLIEREQSYIDFFQSYKSKRGYNIRHIAASKGVRVRKTVQARMFHHSTGTRAPRSAESIAKSAAAWVGRKHRPESIEKMRQAKLGKPEHPNAALAKVAAKSKEYIVTDPDGNEYLIKNMSEHCRKYGLINTSMVRMARGRLGVTQHKGWKCRYP